MATPVDACEDALKYMAVTAAADDNDLKRPHSAGLMTFGQSLFALQHDKAKEAVESERDKVSYHDPKWAAFFQQLMNLTQAEKGYFALTFLVPPQKSLLLRKEFNLVPFYEAIRTELLRLEASIKDDHHHEELKKLIGNVKNFVLTRRKLIEFYSSIDENAKIQRLFEAIDQVASTYRYSRHRFMSHLCWSC